MVKGNTRAIVLAAGKSTRFKRKQGKLVTTICGRPMVLFPLIELEKLGIPMTIVLGYQAEKIKQKVREQGIQNIDHVLQHEMLGTGHAVMCAQNSWDHDNLLILNGDMPLLGKDFIASLIERHESSGAALTFVSTHVINPQGYGRVVEEDGVLKIYEEKDCPERHLDEKRVNAGVYVVQRAFLEETISKIGKSAYSGEFYITDLVALASQQGRMVDVVPAPFDSVRGVNTLQELWAVEQVMRSGLIKYWMNNGVRFELAQSTHLDIDVEIGPDSFIGTGAHILGKTKIGEGCFIAAFTILDNAIIGDETSVHSHSVVQNSVIGDNVHVGPFARLRDNVVLEDNSCVGNFVEIKNSQIGANAKAKHLTYVGDTSVGNNVNIGAGTVVCNYDGQEKHRTTIEEGAFVGSNSTLIAPLTVKTGAYVAAGSTITNDVESDDLAIARARQENKTGYANKLRGRAKVKKKIVKKANQNCKFLGAIKTRGVTEKSYD